MYQVVEASSITELEKYVNKYLESGWIPVGGIQFGSRLGRDMVYQSIFKPKE